MKVYKLAKRAVFLGKIMKTKGTSRCITFHVNKLFLQQTFACYLLKLTSAGSLRVWLDCDGSILQSVGIVHKCALRFSCCNVMRNVACVSKTLEEVRAVANVARKFLINKFDITTRCWRRERTNTPSFLECDKISSILRRTRS